MAFAIVGIPSSISELSMPYYIGSGKGWAKINMVRKIVRLFLWALLAYISLSAINELMKRGG